MDWRREDLSSDYPASEWTLSYAFVKSGQYFGFTASADGELFAVSIAASVTANYDPGIYHWKAYVTKGLERRTIDEGTLEVLPNFAAQTSGYDARSDAQTIFEACEALLLGKATADQKSYTLEGRSLERYGIAELLKLRDRYKSIWDKEQAAERVANGLGSGRKIHTRFI